MAVWSVTRVFHTCGKSCGKSRAIQQLMRFSRVFLRTVRVFRPENWRIEMLNGRIGLVMAGGLGDLQTLRDSVKK
jgi:hypothetical protein